MHLHGISNQSKPYLQRQDLQSTTNYRVNQQNMSLIFPCNSIVSGPANLIQDAKDDPGKISCEYSEKCLALEISRPLYVQLTSTITCQSLSIIAGLKEKGWLNALSILFPSFPSIFRLMDGF